MVWLFSYIKPIWLILLDSYFKSKGHVKLHGVCYWWKICINYFCTVAGGRAQSSQDTLVHGALHKREYAGAWGESSPKRKWSYAAKLFSVDFNWEPLEQALQRVSWHETDWRQKQELFPSNRKLKWVKILCNSNQLSKLNFLKTLEISSKLLWEMSKYTLKKMNRQSGGFLLILSTSAPWTEFQIVH